jgi:GNAT superfamily N-acetyltransferase
VSDALIPEIISLYNIHYMQITEVKGKNEAREFCDFPRRLYKDDPYWVCPLDTETESTFNPLVNQAFRNGEAVRWILRDEGGRTIGRIAAFIDNVRSKANAQPTGGLGYFEVTDNRDAAFLLFDTARNWLSARGMEAMDGPINFGENDANWGLLIDGFMQQGFGIPYNKHYYRKFFEEYGFNKYFEQYSYHRTLRGADGKLDMFPDRMVKIAEWLSRRPGYTFSHFDFRNSGKYIRDLAEVYNSTWASYKEDFTPLETGYLESAMKRTRAFLDEELIWFAYFNDKPIAFFILYPDLNQIIKYFNGSLNLWNKLRFIWYRKSHKMTRIRAVVGGVHPSYQNSGIESSIFLHVYRVLQKKRWYRELELSWVGDFNPKMIAIYEALGATRAKTHYTYRYMINKNLPFIRYKEEIAAKQQAKR